MSKLYTLSVQRLPLNIEIDFRQTYKGECSLAISNQQSSHRHKTSSQDIALNSTFKVCAKISTGTGTISDSFQPPEQPSLQNRQPVLPPVFAHREKNTHEICENMLRGPDTLVTVLTTSCYPHGMVYQPESNIRAATASGPENGIYTLRDGVYRAWKWFGVDNIYND